MTSHAAANQTLHLVAYSPYDRHAPTDPVEHTLHWSAGEAAAYLAGIARDNWEAIAGQDGVPASPAGLTDQQAAGMYFARNANETCSITEVTAPAGMTARPVAASTPPSDTRTCERCGGPWGTDATCGNCTSEDGTPRLTARHAYITIAVRVPAGLRHDQGTARDIALAAQEYASETYGRDPGHGH